MTVPHPSSAGKEWSTRREGKSSSHTAYAHEGSGCGRSDLTRKKQPNPIVQGRGANLQIGDNEESEGGGVYARRKHHPFRAGNRRFTENRANVWGEMRRSG